MSSVIHQKNRRLGYQALLDKDIFYQIHPCTFTCTKTLTEHLAITFTIKNNIHPCKKNSLNSMFHWWMLVTSLLPVEYCRNSYVFSLCSLRRAEHQKEPASTRTWRQWRTDSSLVSSDYCKQSLYWYSKKTHVSSS